ncbi:hypothetical protein LCGC14_2777890, partial [marine sediment metagenome]
MWDRLVSMFSLKRICTIRADFLRGRRVLSDERFLSQLGCAQTDIGRVSLLIRRVFGKICGVAPEMIFPSDDPMRLQSIMDWGQGYGWLFLNYRHWDPFEFDIEFWDEFKADNAITALKSKLALHARTMRDGAFSEIPAADLVPGDMIHVRLGDVVPADAKILSGTNITVDQAALTGESLPVEKESGDVLYSGSALQRGEAECIVYATGAHSFFGKTAKLVAETKVTSHYQKAVMKIGNFLIGISLVLMVVIVIASLYHHRPFIRTLEFVLVLAVAAIPVALPAVLSVTMVVGAMALSKAKAIVSRLVSIEEMAGMDVLCSDKTGTLTKNQLTLGETTLFADVDELQVLRDAALA